MKFMPPKEKTILAPEEGWKANAYYLCEVAFNRSNPIHRYIFYTGFLNERNKTPEGYNEFFRTVGAAYQDAYYIKPLWLIAIDDFDNFSGPTVRLVKIHHGP